MMAILDRAGEALGDGLPRIGGALVLLLVGLLVARLIGRLLAKGLDAAGLDAFADRTGINGSLTRFGIDRPLSKVIGRIIRVGLSIVVILAAVSLLGLSVLSDAINQGVFFLPRVLTALALLLAGVVVGTWAKGQVDRLATQMDLPAVTGRVAELLVFSIFSITALAQVGVSTQILALLVAIVLGGAVASLAIAFGTGGREVARAMSAGRFVRGTYEIGDTIAVAGHRGEITAIESAATVLRTESNSTVRIPNHLMVESVVEQFD